MHKLRNKKVKRRTAKKLKQKKLTKLKPESLKRLRVAGGLITLGLFLGIFPIIYNWNEATARAIDINLSRVSENKSDILVNESPLKSEPIKADNRLLTPPKAVHPILRIIIPSRKIDLPIVEAKVVAGYWEVAETTASHGVGSAYPAENGNVVIFAHARAGMFLPLRDIKVDELVYILGYEKWYRYRVVRTKLVDPKDVEVIAPTETETLTLFTCSGFMDSKRLIVTAVPYAP